MFIIKAIAIITLVTFNVTPTASLSEVSVEIAFVQPVSGSGGSFGN